MKIEVEIEITPMEVYNFLEYAAFCCGYQYRYVEIDHRRYIKNPLHYTSFVIDGINMRTKTIFFSDVISTVSPTYEELPVIETFSLCFKDEDIEQNYVYQIIVNNLYISFLEYKNTYQGHNLYEDFLEKYIQDRMS